jgi:hypothetical protein
MIRAATITSALSKYSFGSAGARNGGFQVKKIELSGKG